MTNVINFGESRLYIQKETNKGSELIYFKAKKLLKHEGQIFNHCCNLLLDTTSALSELVSTPRGSVHHIEWSTLQRQWGPHKGQEGETGLGG